MTEAERLDAEIKKLDDAIAFLDVIMAGFMVFTFWIWIPLYVVGWVAQRVLRMFRG